MPVTRFMSQCLWHEAYGIYATRQPIGDRGDFITAPEISQVFGELLGLWAAVVWRDAMAAPAAVTLGELGPGLGSLMRDALRAAQMVPEFRAGLKCHLIEASAPLIDMQRAALADSGVPITWAHDVSSLRAPAVVIANEFFDTLPLHQWVRTTDGWLPRTVDLDAEGRLTFGVLARGSTRDDIAAALPEAALGAIFESRSPETILQPFVELEASGPVVLLVIDYGHETATVGDTLQAVRSHRSEHPLTSPGEADLSSQVGFAELAAVARSLGLAVDGPLSQAEFLGRLGVVERASKLMSAAPAQALAIESGVARLLSPQGMGGRFKVMALRSIKLPPLPGFAS